MAGQVEVTDKHINWKDDRTITEGRVELSTGSEKKPIHRKKNHAKDVFARTGEPFDLDFTVEGTKDETLMATVHNKGSRSKARPLHFRNRNGDSQKTMSHSITVHVQDADKEKHEGEWSLYTYYKNKGSESSSRGVKFV